MRFAALTITACRLFGVTASPRGLPEVYSGREAPILASAVGSAARIRHSGALIRARETAETATSCGSCRTVQHAARQDGLCPNGHLRAERGAGEHPQQENEREVTSTTYRAYLYPLAVVLGLLVSLVYAWGVK